VFEKVDFTDFSIRAKGSGSGYCGIMFRGTAHLEEFRGYMVHLSTFQLANGVQVQPGGLTEFVPGGGTEVLALAKMVPRRDVEPHDVEIRVKGAEIVVVLNGQEVVKHQEDKKLYKSGGILLQCRKESKLSVSQIEIADLSKAKK